MSEHSTNSGMNAATPGPDQGYHSISNKSTVLKGLLTLVGLIGGLGILGYLLLQLLS